jgi:hypothetical protein
MPSFWENGNEPYGSIKTNVLGQLSVTIIFSRKNMYRGIGYLVLRLMPDGFTRGGM